MSTAAQNPLNPYIYDTPNQIKSRPQDPLLSSFSFSKFPSNFCKTKLNPNTKTSQVTMMPAYAYGVTLSLILLLFLSTAITGSQASLTHANGSAAQDRVEPLVPLIAAENMQTLVLNATRRRLRSFQICALCTCCGGAKGVCLPSPCCYAINCNIPNRPFGFCSFTPKTCNCFGCHI